ncbi:putative lipid II flippase FtsW [Jiangella sp. DSM 45060]|uniref:putative lipid II flippase FtsW n=1 Tax=Jiangella sp. DSM 45060 TaxID=1798224 RepID=UPI00087A656E|nr:putative lipid II flippase FtsW [Jiangella sp. DSM 45060]SDS74381.1 cell division protein FtsW [Jiangella sp. DSM 45060]
MSTVDQRPPGGSAGGAGGSGSGASGAGSKPLRTAATESLRRLLQRPLASYYLVLGSAGLLLVLGLIMVFSASSVMSRVQFGYPYYYFARQLGWVIVGLPMAWVASRMPARLIRRFGLPMLVVAAMLLALTFVPGLGVTRGGNTNWLDLGGPFLIQPSEPAKLALIVWGAGMFALKGRLLTQWKHLMIPFVPVAAAIVALTIGQRDLGTALVLMAIVLTLLWVVGVPTWLFGLALGVVGVVGAYFVTASENRMSRVVSFLDPFSDFSGTGYQAANSIYAFATGGWWGSGLGASRLKWGQLPEAHTDFIFSILGEELGLPGALMVLGLFFALGFAGIRIAMRTTDTFTRLAAAGITGWLIVQAIINLGSVLVVFPVIGVPLPLVSYGGASMVVVIVAVGILMALAKEEPGAREALAARKQARRERRRLRRMRA